MRVLFVTYGAPSHFYPMVPLAWALRVAGHDVVVAYPPGFEATVEAAGLPSRAAGPRLDLAAAWGRAEVASHNAGPSHDTARWEAQRSLRAAAVFVEVAEAMAAGTVDAAADLRAELVVFEPRAYAGPLAARSAGVPGVRHLYGTDYTYGRWESELPVLEPFLRRHGLARADVQGWLTVDPCPPVLQLPTTPRRVVMRYMPYNGAGLEPAWLRREPDRPRVCVTWGTTSGRFLKHLDPVRDVLDALSDMDVELVAAVRAEDRPRLGAVPDGVRVTEDLPLHLLLAGCSAVVHHGGAGTTITSLVCGVPQLVLPAIADQFDNARRVQDCGAGRCVELAAATASRVRAAVVDLLTVPGYRDAAHRVGAGARREPAPAAIAADLVRRIESGSSAPRPTRHRHSSGSSV